MKEKNIDILIGANLKAIRESRGYTQEFVAEKMGCGSDKISRLERGTVALQTKFMKSLSLLYGVKEKDFYTFKTDEPGAKKQYLIDEITENISDLTLRDLNIVRDVINSLKTNK